MSLMAGRACAAGVPPTALPEDGHAGGTSDRRASVEDGAAKGMSAFPDDWDGDMRLPGVDGVLGSVPSAALICALIDSCGSSPGMMLGARVTCSSIMIL